jgi:hypothetical protein
MADRYTKGFDGTQGMERHKGIRIGTLYYSMNKESGDVTIAPMFDDLDSMCKVDIMDDIIGLLVREREELYKKYCIESYGSYDVVKEDEIN